jgi:hypothetical protein
MKKFIDGISKGSEQTLKKLTSVVDKSVSNVSGMIGRLPLIASVEDSEESAQFDEKHFFVIPYRLSDVGYTLHSMRVLPSGVNPINSLPKKRVFHFPNDASKSLIKELVSEEVRSEYTENDKSSKTSFGDQLIDIANDIDRVDTKLTGGVLLVGGLVALLNPVVGAGLAAQALIPGLGGPLSSYGLKNLGTHWNKKALEKEIGAAQEKVLAEFKDSETQYDINPILQELDLALDTTEEQYIPNPKSIQNHSLLDHRKTRLTCKAIYNVYLDIMTSKKTRQNASIGTEDIEWLNQVAWTALDDRIEINEKKLSILSTLLIPVKERLESRDSLSTIRHLEAIEYNLLEALDCDDFSSPRYQMVTRIAEDFIPNAVKSYLALKQSSELSYFQKGKSGEDLFIEQIEVLSTALEALIQESRVNELRTLEIQKRYINELFPLN